MFSNAVVRVPIFTRNTTKLGKTRLGEWLLKVGNGRRFPVDPLTDNVQSAASGDQSENGLSTPARTDPGDSEDF